MTAAGEAGRPAVGEAEVEAGARALYDLNPTYMTNWPQARRKVLWEELDEQTPWRRDSFRARTYAVLAAARPAPAAEGPEVERLRAELESRDAALRESQVALTVASEKQEAAETALAAAHAALRAVGAAITDLCFTVGIIARGNARGIADFDRRADALRKALAEAADPASHDRSAK